MNATSWTKNWQSLPEATVRELQANKLRDFLKCTVLPFSGYYRELFEQHHLTADSFRTLDDLRRIPFTSKADLVNTPEHPQRAKEFVLIPDQKVLTRRPSTILKALWHGKEAVKNGFETEFRPIFMTSTTGRSADPVPFLYTNYDLAQLAVTGRRVFEICGARREYRLLNMFPYAPHLAFWLAHYGGTAFGVFVASTGGGKVMGTEGQLRFMRKLNPEVLVGMPTFVYHVLHQAVEEGLECANLRRIVLGGEKVPTGMRRKLKSLALQLGAQEFDIVATYGFTEAKAAWPECPSPTGLAPTGYHLFPDFGIFEVIDPKTGEPLPPESPGELVYTAIDGRGSVVLRYRTGDYIDGGLTCAQCPACGRTVPRLVGKISRHSEIREMHMEKLKGTLVDFNQLEHVLDDAPHVGAWQLELRKRNDDPLEIDELVLHVHSLGDLTEQQLSRDLANRFAAQTEVKPNRILFHDAAEMRDLQGVGTSLKELRVVDHRPVAGADYPKPVVEPVARIKKPNGHRTAEIEATT